MHLASLLFNERGNIQEKKKNQTLIGHIKLGFPNLGVCEISIFLFYFIFIFINARIEFIGHLFS